MKVLIMLTSSNVGGGPKVVYDLVEELLNQGAEIVVALPPHGMYVEKFQHLRVTVVTAPLDTIKGTLSAFLTIRSTIHRYNVDVIHSHGKGAGLVGRLAGLLTHVPVIHTHHGIHIGSYKGLVKKLYIAYEKILGAATYKIVNVSYSQQQLGLELGILSPAKSTVIYNGVPDLATIKAETIDKTLSTTWENKQLVVNIARFDPIKNQAWLVEAFAQYQDPNTVLLIAGGGECEDSLHRRRQQLQATNIIIAGYTNQVPHILKAASVVVLSSHMEGLPTVLIEAMSLSKPLLGANVPGISEVIKDQHNGLLYQPDDKDDFCRKLKYLLKPTHAQALAANGRKLYQELYNSPICARQHLELYTEAMT